MATPLPPEPDRLLEHDYDGIREYDNPMPRWWLWVFYITILFVPAYYLAPAPFGAGSGKDAEYAAEVARYQASRPPAPAGVTAATLLARRNDREDLEEGAEVFAKNCAACHRADGGGLIGPNLTDDVWLHGGTPVAIHTTIVQGVMAKGMPAWERLLSPEAVEQVTAYVLSLAGTNPPNPKAPEGVADRAAVPPAR
jgi:cytochrome c oxidase cbb3-type subunit 3